MLRTAWLLCACAVLGCSSLIEPDPGRLGGDEEIDGGSERRDGGMLPNRDSGPPIRDSGRPADGGGVRDGGVDAGCSVAPRCVGGSVESCDGTTECEYGCAPGGLPRCAEFVPSNVDARLWSDSARSLTVTGAGEDAGFDTTMCRAMSVDSMVVTQEGGGEVCVLVVRDLTIEREGRLNVVGDRPLVILASGEVRIEEGGILDVSASGAQPGPGGGAGGTRRQPMGAGASGGAAGARGGTFADGGGGGGGFGGAGGSGGSGGGANGGLGGARVTAAWLSPLRGGGGGGIGEGGPTLFGAGGAGGGALQISARGELVIEGSILAGGGGGRGGGFGNPGNWGAGGGGGSGGGILLESPSITLAPSAGVLASGGGGGAGSGGTAPGEDGDDGLQLFGRAAGGGSMPGSRYGAAGGPSGGGDAVDALDGESNSDDGGNGGGGGGGAGVVVYRTATGTLPENAVRVSSGSVAPSLASGPILVR